MSRRVQLPDEQSVCGARDSLIAGAAAGERVSVVALAKRLGLSNTTFWRHYPTIAAELVERQRTPSQPDVVTTSPDDESARQQLAALKRANEALRTQLEAAAAQIGRLALENHRLRNELEASSNVTSLTAARAVAPTASTQR